MNCEDAATDRGRRVVAMPALLDDTKRILDVFSFVYALNTLMTRCGQSAVRIFVALVDDTFAELLPVYGVSKRAREGRSVARLEEINMLVPPS